MEKKIETFPLNSTANSYNGVTCVIVNKRSVPIRLTKVKFSTRSSNADDIVLLFNKDQGMHMDLDTFKSDMLRRDCHKNVVVSRAIEPWKTVRKPLLCKKQTLDSDAKLFKFNLQSANVVEQLTIEPHQQAILGLFVYAGMMNFKDSYDHSARDHVFVENDDLAIQHGFCLDEQFMPFQNYWYYKLVAEIKYQETKNIFSNLKKKNAFADVLVVTQSYSMQ